MKGLKTQNSEFCDSCKNFFSKKAQTATEYMILLAVVIVIAIVVAAILGDFPSIGGGSSKNIDDYKLTTSKVAIDKYACGSDNSTYVVKNNHYTTLIVSKIVVDGTNCDSEDFSFILNIGQSKNIVCSNINCNSLGETVGERFKETPAVEITWEDTTTGASYTEGDSEEIVEICNNLIDDDDDGFIDCEDSDCSPESICDYYITSEGIVKSPGLSPGDTFELEGITYKVVNNSLLDAMNPTSDNFTNISTTHVTNMSWILNGNVYFNQDISSWDVSNVTDMSLLFLSLQDFNQDISSWDVSSVKNMGSMFQSASDFNQDISSWDVSSVTNMNNLFNYATLFNGDISSWDVSSVESMSSTFNQASNFNQSIGSWDVSSVTNMMDMFYYAVKFNQNISDWNVSSVTLMYQMFQGASDFDQNISSWDVSSVTNHDNFDTSTSASWIASEKPNFPT